MNPTTTVETDLDQTNTSTPKSGLLIRLIVVVLVLGLLFFFGRRAGAAIPEFAAWVDGLGFWGPLVYVFGYAVATVAFIPGSLLTLAAGAIFGLGKGVVVVFVGATLGAALSFLVARYAARKPIEKRLGGNKKFETIDAAIGREGRKIVFLLRLSPVFPFNLLNYGLGLTKVRFVDYLVASIGMLPGTLLYVYYGKLAGDVAALAGGAGVQKDAKSYALLGIGLLATIVVTAVVTKTAKKALAAEVDLE